MKKIIVSGVLLFSLFGLTACANTGEEIANNAINDPISQSDNTTLQADVQTTTLDMFTYSQSHMGFDSIPITGEDAFIVTESEPSNVVTVTGNFNGWKVVGINSETGYTYSYDSTTGQYN
jgi:hypothetical protein